MLVINALVKLKGCCALPFKNYRHFNVTSYSERELIWREVRTLIGERKDCNVTDLIILGSLIMNGRTELKIFDNGTATGDHCCQQVIFLHSEVPFRGDNGNASPHQIFAIEELL